MYRGELGLFRWVGWGIIAHNLTIISKSYDKKLDKLSRLSSNNLYQLIEIYSNFIQH